MKISKRNSNFAQFSDDLWLKVNINGVKFDFDVPSSELKDFSLMLLDTVWDSVWKMREKKMMTIFLASRRCCPI